jgi:hypothetical protein
VTRVLVDSHEGVGRIMFVIGRFQALVIVFLLTDASRTPGESHLLFVGYSSVFYIWDLEALQEILNVDATHKSQDVFLGWSGSSQVLPVCPNPIERRQMIRFKVIGPSLVFCKTFILIMTIWY